MKQFFLLLLTAMVVSQAWCQTDQTKDLIYTADDQVVEAAIVEVSSKEVRYREWNNQHGPMFVLSAEEIRKIEFSNGTVKTYAPKNPAQPAQPVQTAQTAQPAKPAQPAPPVGFQFNIDIDGNLAYISGTRVYCSGNQRLESIDRDFAIGGVNVTLGAGVRMAQWLYAGVAAGVLGEWGTPRVIYTDKDGRKEEGKATYSAYAVPIYANVRTYAPTRGHCYPYAEFGVGGYVGINGSVEFGDNKIEELCGTPEGGFYFLSGVGLEFRMLNIGAGYKLMRNNNFTGNHGYVKIGLSLGRPQKLRRCIG